MHILVVEDEPETRLAIELILQTEGHQVLSADCGEDAVVLARDFRFDIAILDLQLPDITGFDVLKQFWAHRVKMPVIVVSGCGPIEVKVKALTAGAADFVVKPFHRDELVARIEAITRRTGRFSSNIVDVGDLRIDLACRQAFYAKCKLNLTRTEYKIIELLALHFGQFVSHEIILTNIYGVFDRPEWDTVAVFMCRIRKILNLASKGAVFIRNQRGIGFMLVEKQISSAIKQAAE